MSIRFSAVTAFVALSLLTVSSWSSAGNAHAVNEANTQIHQDANSNNALAPKMVLSTPRADFLKDGVVYIPFHVENMTILPVYSEIHGEAITLVKPIIGHLHVMVDDNKWAWVHASTDPIYFSPLSSGSHKVTVELSNASHKVLQTQTLKLMVP